MRVHCYVWGWFGPVTWLSKMAINHVKINHYNLTSISFHKALGLRLAHTNCDCREFYPRTVIYIFTISQFTVTAQSEQELYMWTEHACKSPSTCEGVLYVCTEPPTEIGFSTCERDHSPRQCHKHGSHISISTYIAFPRQALSYTMRCPPGHTIYHAIPL